MKHVPIEKRRLNRNWRNEIKLQTLIGLLTDEQIEEFDKNVEDMTNKTMLRDSTVKLTYYSQGKAVEISCEKKSLLENPSL